MHRRQFLKIVAAGAANSVVPGTPQVEAQSPPPSGPPNILIVISDQNRAGLTKRSGYSIDTSPTLDRIAAQGVDFQSAYSTQPVCSPCRPAC